MLSHDRLSERAKEIIEVINILGSGETQKLLADLAEKASVAKVETERLARERAALSQLRQEITDAQAQLNTEREAVSEAQKRHSATVAEHQDKVSQWQADSALRNAGLDMQARGLKDRAAMLDEREEKLATWENVLTSRQTLLEKREKSIARKMTVLTQE